MDQKKIGGFLRELRKSAGFTQEQAAEKLGISSRTISRWETGAYMPDISMLVDIAELYDVDIRNRKAAVAIYVAREWRNQGVGKIALQKLKSYVTNILCFRLLYAMVRETNLTSQKLFQAVGFQRVACLPEWVNEGNILVLQTIL